MAYLVDLEACQARVKSKGSRGEQTVGLTIAEGFRFLADPSDLLIAAGSILVSAMAAPTGLAPAPNKRCWLTPSRSPLSVGGLGISAKGERVCCSVARSFLVSCFEHNARMNDALNATFWVEEGIIVGRTPGQSKDGLPLELFAPGDGWLGPFIWLAEHLASMPSSKHDWPQIISCLHQPGQYGQIGRASSLGQVVASNIVNVYQTYT